MVFVNSNGGGYPFLLVGPRDGEKTDFLLACALANAAEAQLHDGDRRNVLILCLHQLVVDQIRLCFEKIMPDTGGLGVNCMSYYQLMREAGYNGPPRVSVPPSFLRAESNRGRLVALLRERFSLILFDQIFEAFRYFPELIQAVPSETLWAGAISCPRKMNLEFEQLLRDLRAGVPNLVIRKTQAADRKYQSREFLHLSSIDIDAAFLENWVEESVPASVEVTARAWPRVIVMHRSIWRRRRRIAREVAEYLRSRGFRLFNSLDHNECLESSIPDVAIVTEFGARGLASAFSLVIHDCPDKLISPKFLANEEELEGGAYDTKEWNIRRLSPREPAGWTQKQLSEGVFLHNGRRVFVTDYFAVGPEKDWLVEIKEGLGLLRVSPEELCLAEPLDDQE